MKNNTNLSDLQLQQSLGQVFITLQTMVLSFQNCLCSVSGISVPGLIPRLLCRGGEVHTVLSIVHVRTFPLY